MTIAEWFNDLPDPIREKAIENQRLYPLPNLSPDITCSNMASAIWFGFHWLDTPEGYDFWNEIYYKYYREAYLN